MSALFIEGGCYFLLLFTPLAFGGVEMWAHGVFQIVTGFVVAAWAVSRIRSGPSIWPAAPAPSLRAVWIPIGLFVLLVLVQLVPMPAGWLDRLSPPTHDLYSRSVPGYAEGRDFTSADLIPWLIEDQRDHLTATPDQVEAIPADLDPPPTETGFTAPSSAWRTLSIYPHETRLRLTSLLCYIGLFAVVVSHFRTKERIGRLLSVTAFSAFAVSLLGIIQRLTWNEKLFWLREGDYPGAFGPFVNRNSYSAFAGTLLPLAICMALEAFRRLKGSRDEALPRLILWSLIAVVIGGGVFYSLSRGGILAAGMSVIAISAFVIYYGRWAMGILVVGALAVASVGLLLWIGPRETIERVGTLSEGQNVPTFARRLTVWDRSVELISDHPVFGTGLGTFGYAFKRYAPPTRSWWRRAHNEYVELVCDTGLIGGMIILAGLIAYLYHVARPSRFRNRPEQFVYAGLASGLLGLALHSAVSSNLQVPANGMMVAILGAVLLRLSLERGPRGGRGSGMNRAASRGRDSRSRASFVRAVR